MVFPLPHGTPQQPTPRETGRPPEEGANPHWGDGRLVMRRPEVPDSDIAAMSVINSAAEAATLSKAVHLLIQQYKSNEARSQGSAGGQGEAR